MCQVFFGHLASYSLLMVLKVALRSFLVTMNVRCSTVSRPSGEAQLTLFRDQANKEPSRWHGQFCNAHKQTNKQTNKQSNKQTNNFITF